MLSSEVFSGSEEFFVITKVADSGSLPWTATASVTGISGSVVILVEIGLKKLVGTGSICENGFISLEI